MQPSDILRARFELEAKLSSTGSLTGIQLEQLRDGRQGSGAHTDGASRLIIAYMEAVRRTKHLTPEEEAICRLRYLLPVGHESYARPEYVHNASEAARELGEIPVSSSDVPPGMVKMVGVRARLASWAEIGEVTDMTPKQVQHRFDRACAKVRAALWGEQKPEIEPAPDASSPLPISPQSRLAKLLYQRANRCTECKGQRVVRVVMGGQDVARTCKCQVL